jgi:hypothetical protein
MDVSFIVVMVVLTALAFDFTNGFHDTANAMATSIATGAFRPKTGHTKFESGPVDTGALMAKPLWTIEDLSAYLSVPVATIYKWRRTGEAPRRARSPAT